MTFLAPLGVTILAATGAWVLTRRFPEYPSSEDGLALIVAWLVAVIITLIAWLIWALMGGTQ